MCLEYLFKGINIIRNRSNRVSDINTNNNDLYDNENCLPNYVSTIYFDNQIRHLLSDEVSIYVIEMYLKRLDMRNLEEIYRKLHCIIIDDDNLSHSQFIRINDVCFIIYRIAEELSNYNSIQMSRRLDSESSDD